MVLHQNVKPVVSVLMVLFTIPSLCRMCPLYLYRSHVPLVYQHMQWCSQNVKPVVCMLRAKFIVSVWNVAL